ncbi:molybdenum ABC transporter ATP-binding protein [Vibrio astriarenae]
MIHIDCQTTLGSLVFDLNFKIASQGVTVLFGPSGCGKTTTLRTLTGLTKLPNCQVKFHDELWQSKDGTSFLPPHKRNLGYVFQHPSLFQHLNVEQNIKFGLRGNESQSASVEVKDRLVELLGLKPLLSRAVHRLSGGEQQRVAIARALVVQPRLLLMDEPLSALDEARKQEIMPYLESMTQDLSIPIVYVTHSLSEVSRLADEVVVLEAGKIASQGELQTCLAPMSYHYDAHAVRSVIELNIVEHTYDGMTLLSDGTTQLWVSLIKAPLGSLTRCEILASDVSIGTSPMLESSIINALPARVLAVEPTGNPAEVLIKMTTESKQTLYSMITQRSVNRLNLTPGKSVWAYIKAVAIG